MSAVYVLTPVFLYLPLFIVAGLTIACLQAVLERRYIGINVVNCMQINWLWCNCLNLLTWRCSCITTQEGKRNIGNTATVRYQFSVNTVTCIRRNPRLSIERDTPIFVNEVAVTAKCLSITFLFFIFPVNILIRRTLKVLISQCFVLCCNALLGKYE